MILVLVVQAKSTKIAAGNDRIIKFFDEFDKIKSGS